MSLVLHDLSCIAVPTGITVPLKQTSGHRAIADEKLLKELEENA